MCFPSSKNETRSANIPIEKAAEAKLHVPPGSVGYVGQRLTNEEAAEKAAKAVMEAVVDVMWEEGFITTGDEPALQFPMDDLDLE